jgi:hypothetical protein
MSNFKIKYMSAQKKYDSKVRINRTELLLIDAIEQATKEHPEITTAEIGAAMLKLLTKINNDEIVEQCGS